MQPPRQAHGSTRNRAAERTEHAARADRHRTPDQAVRPARTALHERPSRRGRPGDPVRRGHPPTLPSALPGRGVKYLFVHQNFPGQFLHIVRHLVASRQHDVVFLTEPNANQIPGVRKVPYPKPNGAAPETHIAARELDGAVRRAEIVAPHRRQSEAARLRPGHHHRPSWLGRTAEPLRRLAGRAHAWLSRVLLQHDAASMSASIRNSRPIRRIFRAYGRRTPST